MTVEPTDPAAPGHPGPAVGAPGRADLPLASSRGEILTLELERNSSRLKTALAHDDHSIRTLALGALDRLGALQTQDLEQALTDQHRDVRVRAIELSISNDEIDLAAFLDDDDDLVVETTAWALGERLDASAHVIGALSRVATTHEVAICREAAVAALGATGDVSGLPAILHGMTDKATVRRRAVLALAPFDEPEALRAIEAALEDRDRQVRQAAEDLH